MSDRKEYYKKYYRKNRKRKMKQHKIWRQNHPEYDKEYQRQWKKDNPEKVQKYNKDNRKRKKEEYEKKRKWMINYKLNRGCSICGYNKCADALDFHHPNDDKEFEIGRAMSSKSLEEIEKEMSKCILLCANCHKELHAKERK